jgi:hypothetical protein
VLHVISQPNDKREPVIPRDSLFRFQFGDRKCLRITLN